MIVYGSIGFSTDVESGVETDKNKCVVVCM